MSTVKANNVQVGQSGTASQNFTLYQPSTPDGTVRLAVGNSGATTGDVLSVSSTGLSVTGTLTSTGVNTFPAGSASAPSITTTGDTNTGVYFPAADTVGVTTGGAEAARINSSGTLILKGGSTSATGVGITFPADTTTTVSSNANTLDDYEEGTWTPSLTSSSGSLTTVSNGTGNYTKIGNCVTVTCAPSITTNGTGSGRLIISGLPFARGKNQLTGASREDGAVGFVFGISEETTTSIGLTKYDATYPGGNGYRFAISITYLI